MSFQQPAGGEQPPPPGGGPYGPPPGSYGAQPHGQSYGGPYPPPGAHQPGAHPYGAPPPFGQPMYGPPGYGIPQPPQRRGPKVGVIVAAVVGVLAVGTVAVLGATGAFSSDDKSSVAEPTSSASASVTGRPTSAPPAPPEPPTRPTSTPSTAKRGVDTPARAGGLDRMGDDAYPLQTTIRRQAVAGSKVAAYGPAGAGTPTALVMVMANPSPQLSPALVMDQIIAGMQDGAQEKSADVGNVRQMDPGTLGGVLRCTSIRSGGKALPTCVWADPDTVGVVYAINETSLDAASALTLRVRPDLEK
ncbi:hypothetical protein [Embleya scabrispora]|uniref:hypothetical protein n=1 Tax=Embleya scabrispora TaxID=159449 RepID=UPI00131A08AB|nr:hypothetical protein [Embleya scabrispora]MYS86328.1 hypothetical protein [Streptomyces sp. SID5474]